MYAVQITELSKEVFRLKEALNVLPESRGPPQSPPNTAALQAKIRALEEKLVVGTGGSGGHRLVGSGLPQAPSPMLKPSPHLQEAEKRHSKVVTLYRSHLLYAVQVRWGRGWGGIGDTGMGDWGTSQPRLGAHLHVGGSQGAGSKCQPTHRDSPMSPLMSHQCPLYPRATCMRTCRNSCARS